MSATLKAAFYAVDTPTVFQVQYNPRELKFDKGLSWKEHDDQGQPSALEFQKASPASIELELIFDTTSDRSDVRVTWVNKLLELTNPTARPRDGEAAELDKRRPTIVWFVWGGLRFQGVVEAINVTYLMFAADGAPLRARATVRLKEWRSTHVSASLSRSTGYSTQRVRLVEVGSGETLSMLAARYGTTARAIGEANDLTDLLAIEAGLELVIPS